MGSSRHSPTTASARPASVQSVLGQRSSRRLAMVDNNTERGGEEEEGANARQVRVPVAATPRGRFDDMEAVYDGTGDVSSYGGSAAAWGASWDV